MSFKRQSSPQYSRNLTAKSFVSKVRLEPNELRKKMLVLGYVTTRLEKKRQTVVLVGGQAVETYTAGQFPSGDIDITTTDSPTTEKVLASLGFKREGMIWFSKQLGIAFQIVGYSPSGSLERSRILKVGPYRTRIVGVEDLILDRLQAAKFWNIPSDYEKAKVLYENFRKQIDQDYLREIAKRNNVEDSLLRVTEAQSPRLARRAE
jgi:hypothetical protein